MEHSTAMPRLSEREEQLLKLAARGFTDNAIAHKLGISLPTVSTYWGRVRVKLGPMNRTELVAVYLREQSTGVVEQLKSENSKLLVEIQEHARTSEMLRASLELFRGLVETAPDGILLVDDHGDIQLVNEQAQTMFGYTQDELLKMNVLELMPERYREVHAVHRQSYVANPVRRRMGEHLATYALRKDGTEFVVATALSGTQTQNGLLITCIVRDLTPQG